MKQFNLKLPNDMLVKIKAASEHTGISISALVRTAITEYLDRRREDNR